MRLVFIGVLFLGLGLAGFAVYMAQDYIAQNEAALAAERQNSNRVGPVTDVLVAARSVRYGDQLEPSDVRRVRWPERGVPAGAFTDPSVLFPEGSEPRAVLRAMEEGEAILEVKVTKPGQDAGVSSKLAPGMRAFALRVDVSSGVSGFLRPGDRVDVYWTGANVTASGGRREITKLIMSQVKLIAVDQSADEDRNHPTVARTVTIEGSPQQVAALAQAQSTGRLQLSLVGAQDDTVISDVVVDQGEFLGVVEEVVEVAPQREVCTIRTRKGAEMVDVEIPCN